MVRVAFKRGMTWAIIVAAVLMAVAMAGGYLGAFLSPEENIRDFPIGIVNEDAGISLAGQEQNRGADVVGQITAPNPAVGDAIAWKTLESRQAAVDAIDRNKLYAALVIPADFTQRLAGLARPALVSGEPAPAEIEVLYNHGAGSIAGSQGKDIVLTAANRVDVVISRQLLAGIEQQGGAVDAAVVPFYADPVMVVETDLAPAGEDTGKGMGAFYLAVVIVVGAFLATDVISFGTDFLAGHASLGPRLEKLRGAAVPMGLMDLFRAKLALVIIAAIAIGASDTWLAHVVLGLPVANDWALFGVATLGALAIGALTLMLIAALGTPGILIALLFTTILGVPSAGGVFPNEMLPKIYQALGTVLPVRYLTDALRSLVFFDGRWDAGLAAGVGVLAAYAVGAIALGWFFAWAMDRDRHTRPEAVAVA